MLKAPPSEASDSTRPCSTSPRGLCSFNARRKGSARWPGAGCWPCPRLPPARDSLAGLPLPSFPSRVNPRHPALHLQTAGSSAGRAGRWPPALLLLPCTRSACFPCAGGGEWVLGQLLMCGGAGGALALTSPCPTCACGVAWRLCASATCSSPSRSSRKRGPGRCFWMWGHSPQWPRAQQELPRRLLVGPGSCQKKELTGCPQETRARRPCPCPVGRRTAGLPGPPLVALSSGRTRTPFWAMVPLETAPFA